MKLLDKSKPGRKIYLKLQQLQWAAKISDSEIERDNFAEE